MEIRKALLWISYSLAPTICGVGLGFVALLSIHSAPGDALRAGALALGSLAVIVVCWFAISESRPYIGALFLVASMWCALVLGAGIGRFYVAGSAATWELLVLALCAVVFFFGAWLSRRSKWSRKWFPSS